MKKWLRAGVSEDGEWSPTKVGTPQGAVISPLLANVFLHDVLDLWMEAWRKRHATGEVIIVRYADDFVIGFREEADAKHCLAALRERFTKFGLELHPEKTRLIEFGRYATERRKQRGAGPRRVISSPTAESVGYFRDVSGGTSLHDRSAVATVVVGRNPSFAAWVFGLHECQRLTHVERSKVSTSATIGDERQIREPV